MRGKEIPNDIVGYDARQRVGEPRIVRRFRGIIHRDVVPIMLATDQLINGHCGPAVAFGSKPARYAGQRSD